MGMLGNLIVNYVAIAMAIVLLTLLIIICIKGEVRATEPRRWVLITEIIIMIATIGLAVYNLVGFYRVIY